MVGTGTRGDVCQIPSGDRADVVSASRRVPRASIFPNTSHLPYNVCT